MIKLMSSLMVPLVIVFVFARNSSELKSDLQALMPSGVSSIRLAYIKSLDGYQEFAMSTRSTSVWVVSSEEPTPRRVYPASGTGNFYNVNLTSNGSRLFFWDKARNQIVMVNWDGSNVKTLPVTGTLSASTEYWLGPNSSDWAIVNNQNSVVGRINLDTKEVVHMNMNRSCYSAPVSLSDDGTRLLVQAEGGFGLYNLTDNTFSMGPNGCQPSLRAGGSHQWNLNPSAHDYMMVMNPNGTLFMKYETAKTVNAFLATKGLTGSCGPGELRQEGTRFTQHPDFVTFFISNSKANPILVRLPDMKSTYIEDNLTCNFIGDMDGVFLRSPTSVAGHRRTLSTIDGNHGTSQVYSVTGRREPDRTSYGISVVTMGTKIVSRKLTFNR